MAGIARPHAAKTRRRLILLGHRGSLRACTRWPYERPTHYARVHFSPMRVTNLGTVLVTGSVPNNSRVHVLCSLSSVYSRSRLSMRVTREQHFSLANQPTGL